MTAPLSIHDVTAADWSPLVGGYGALVEGLDDIAQCLRIAILTPKGSVPHRPDFGCDAYLRLDHPINAIRSQLVADMLDAAARCEPRAKVLSCTVDVDAVYPGRVEIRLRWAPLVGGGEINTTVSLAGAA